MSQMLKLSAPISELRPVVAALRFDSFRSAMHDIHDITDREPCERLAMHQLTAWRVGFGSIVLIKSAKRRLRLFV